jgi:hypothetical protein
VKPIRHRKGEVPQWLNQKADNLSKNLTNNINEDPKSNSKIKYVGFTADGVGMVIETQASKIV